MLRFCHLGMIDREKHGIPLKCMGLGRDHRILSGGKTPSCPHLRHFGAI